MGEEIVVNGLRERGSHSGDGAAKGGILFALAKRTGLPIRFIGVGEQLEDLRPFNAEEFVQALFEDVTA